MDFFYLPIILTPLFFTSLIETPLYYFLLRFRYNRGLLVLTFLNIFTNVTMNLIYIFIFPYELYIYIAEVVVFLIEGIFLSIYILNLDYKSSLIGINDKGWLINSIYILFIAFITNFISYILGTIFNSFIYNYIKDIYILLIYIAIFIVEIIIIILINLKRHKV